MLTREQRYARRAYEHVISVQKRYGSRDDFVKKYGSMAHKLPVLIRTAGLAQALAFVISRGEDAHHILLDHLAEVTISGSRDELLRRSLGEGDPHTATLSYYIRLTEQVLDALVWYKRFAESVLKVSVTGDSPEDAESRSTPADMQASIGEGTGTGGA
jgi:CRISPR-associated protein Cmr5